MTQHEISEFYGVPQCDVSVAVNRYGVKPIEKNGRITQWDKVAVGNALYELYCEREKHLLGKAFAWNRKAQSILENIGESL